MSATQAAPHKAKKEKSRVYSFFLLSYTLILLVSLSICLFFGAEITQQLRREEALNKQVLPTSLKNDVEDINDLILQSAPGGAGEDNSPSSNPRCSTKCARTLSCSASSTSSAPPWCGICWTASAGADTGLGRRAQPAGEPRRALLRGRVYRGAGRGGFGQRLFPRFRHSVGKQSFRGAARAAKCGLRTAEHRRRP